MDAATTAISLNFWEMACPGRLMPSQAWDPGAICDQQRAGEVEQVQLPVSRMLRVEDEQPACMVLFGETRCMCVECRCCICAAVTPAGIDICGTPIFRSNALAMPGHRAFPRTFLRVLCRWLVVLCSEIQICLCMALW